MKLRPFELALVGVFSALIIISLFILATYSPPPSEEEEAAVIRGAVTIWGTLPAEQINILIDEIANLDGSFSEVSYRFIERDEFDQELTNALADGIGPDLIFVSHERLVDQRRRIRPISYESLPLRDVRTRYVDGIEIFALSDGVYMYPVMVDPLMLFWNRNILSSQGLLAAPKTWEELINVQFPSLVERSFDRTITQSVVAMGEYRNVRNAFGVISALLLQSGTRGVIENSNTYEIALQEAVGADIEPLTSVADFYVRFSRPSNALYSWNRSFSEDRVQFIGEDLVMYFGYGSEGREIERLNPNLNFDIAEIPQGATANVRRTYGRFYGLAALNSSENLSSAFAVMFTLGAERNAQRLANDYGMAPAYRSLVAVGSNDTFGSLIYKSATVSYGWLNPDIARTDEILSTMTSDINENRRSSGAAANDAVVRLRSEY